MFARRKGIGPTGIGGALVLACCASATAQLHQVQEIDFTIPLSPGAVSLPIARFDDAGGTRELLEVRVTLEGTIGALVTAENDSTLPAPDLTLNIAGFMNGQLDGLGVAFGFSDVFLTDGTVAPSDGVPGSGPDFWDFGLVTVANAGADATTAVAGFTGAGTIDADVTASGGFSVSGSTDSTIVVTDFAAAGRLTVTYVYDFLPVGACCFPDGACGAETEANCLAAGGAYYGDGSICTASTCPLPPRGDASAKGSLVVFHKVEIRWDAAFALMQDTFLSLTNDANEDVQVQMYFINGDPPLPAVLNGAGQVIERAHPGWNRVDNGILLTANQPTYWSALTGQPADGGLSPFAVLDPAGIGGPGRPATDGSTDRVLRGYVLAWAVDDDGNEIRFNHLKGEGTIVGYAGGSAWEYGTMNFPVVSGVPHGAEPDGVPGVLRLDGIEYAAAFDQLLLDFQAAGSLAFGIGAPRTAVSDTDVTLHPLAADLRQETDGPVTTKAAITVWNQNEVKLSGAHRCVTCWDQQLLSLYDIQDGGPNHFVRANLQTDHGKARIDGVASALCDVDFDPGDGLPLGDDPRDVVSVTAALAGVSARLITFDLGVAGQDAAAAGNMLVGLGSQSAVIRHDVIGAPPEASGRARPVKRGASHRRSHR